MKLIRAFYRNRFCGNKYVFREKIWQILCNEVFQEMIDEKDTVMDIGAGYCEFINKITCNRKIAVDLNPDTKLKSKKGIEVLNINVSLIPKRFDGKVDVIFMSNFLEHLNSKNEVISILQRSYKLLRNRGKIIIMQPNIDLVGTNYWNFIDHSIPLNLPSLTEALETAGFEIRLTVKKFLPYTTKNNYIPYADFLLRLYLLIPSSFRPFAGQSLIVAQKKNKN